jgi:hypothetical protein
VRAGPAVFPDVADSGHIEKVDDAKAKARVKEQIEADKRARAEKTAAEKACVVYLAM